MTTEYYGRQHFNDGQEFKFSDLLEMGAMQERNLFDIFFKQLTGGKTDAFFGDSFKVTRTNTTTASITEGMGIIEESSAVFPEPENRPLIQFTGTSETLSTAHATLDRIDIICVTYNYANYETDTRRYKDASSDEITDQSMATSKLWSRTIQIVEGTPDASPVAPSVPAGYIKIAECYITAAVGMSNDSSITDTRKKFPVLAGSNETGNMKYDAIVGDTNLAGVTHSTLASAISAVGSNAHILVLQDEIITSQINVLGNDVVIEFKRGATIIKNGAFTNGIQLQGNDCHILNGRFKDFGAGVYPINTTSGSKRNVIQDCRFNTCTNTINNESDDTTIRGILEEV
jgi:hypothetical protein